MSILSLRSQSFTLLLLFPLPASLRFCSSGSSVLSSLLRIATFTGTESCSRLPQSYFSLISGRLRHRTGQVGTYFELLPTPPPPPPGPESGYQMPDSQPDTRESHHNGDATLELEKATNGDESRGSGEALEKEADAILDGLLAGEDESEDASVSGDGPPRKGKALDIQLKAPGPQRRKMVGWMDLPHKGQLTVLTLARLAEPLVQTSLQVSPYR